VPKGEESRKRIVGQALKLASTLGLEGLTLGKLAEALDVSKSGLFAHFDSKEALQLAVVQEASERFIAEVIAPALAKPRGEPRVQALFAHKLEWVGNNSSPGGCLFMAATAEFDDRPGPVRDLLLASQRDWIDVLARAAQIAIQEKHFRSDLDPDQLALELESRGYDWIGAEHEAATAPT